jgi:hypothetical protein
MGFHLDDQAHMICVAAQVRSRSFRIFRFQIKAIAAGDEPCWFCLFPVGDGTDSLKMISRTGRFRFHG